jgi:hypothetical protein
VHAGVVGEAVPGEVIASEPQRAAYLAAGEVQSGALDQVEQQTGEMAGLVEELQGVGDETSEITRPVDVESLPRMAADRNSEPPTLPAAEVRNLTTPSGPRNDAEAHLLEADGDAAEQVPWDAAEQVSWDDILSEDEPLALESDNLPEHAHSARRASPLR